MFVDFPASSCGPPRWYPRRWEPLSTTLVSGPAPRPQMQPLTCPFHKLSQMIQGKEIENQLSSSLPHRMVDALCCEGSSLPRQIQFSAQALGQHPAYCSEVAQVQQDPTRPAELEHEVTASQAPSENTAHVCFWPPHSPLGCWLQGQPHPCSHGAIICAYKEPGQP